MRYGARRGSLLPYVTVATAAALVALVMNRRWTHPADAAEDRPRGAPRGEAGGQGSRPRLAAISPKAAAEAGEASDYVRPAGPEAMRDPPRRGWDKLDEASDESFPASDPPGNY